MIRFKFVSVNVRDIHTTNWQLSIERAGSIVTGLDDVRQCIDVILKTRKGEDPLRPHFGCGLFDWIDKPVNTAIPNMKKEILDALAKYEPRIRVTSLLHEIVNGGVKFGINYKLPEGDSDFFELTATEEGMGEGDQLILQASYEDAIRYFIDLALEGNRILPKPPFGGFGSIADMFAWVTNYWYTYGTWHWLFAQKKLVVYVPSNVAGTGQLNILSVNNALTAIIEELTDSSQRYIILFIDNTGSRITPFNDLDLNTRAGILNFVQLNYSSYGTWAIDGNKLVLTGSIILEGYTLAVEVTSALSSSFSQDFNSAFES